MHKVNLIITLLHDRRHLESDRGDGSGTVHLGGKEYLLGITFHIC